MPWARASSLDRHLACPAASWYPRADRGNWSPGFLAQGILVAPPVGDAVARDLPPAPTSDSRYADWGTAMHEAKAGNLDEPFASMMEPHRAQLWPDDMGRHEVCVAYDCRTRQVILGPANLPKAEQDAWKAAQSDDCVTGVSDWLGELPDGLPWNDDLKTGWRRPDPASKQSLFYLMVWAKARKQEQGWSSITWWPRGTDTTPSRSGLWRKVTAVAFDALEDELHRGWLAAIGFSRNDPQWRPSPRPGDHCHYCPSASVCPRAFE